MIDLSLLVMTQQGTLRGDGMLLLAGKPVLSIPMHSFSSLLSKMMTMMKTVEDIQEEEEDRCIHHSNDWILSLNSCERGGVVGCNILGKRRRGEHQSDDCVSHCHGGGDCSHFGLE